MPELAKAPWKSIGQNVESFSEGDYTYLRIDHTADYGLSQSGKSIVVASTKGNVHLGSMRLGVNAYKPK